MMEQLIQKNAELVREIDALRAKGEIHVRNLSERFHVPTDEAVKDWNDLVESLKTFADGSALIPPSAAGVQ
jgi:hypothetical protein